MSEIYPKVVLSDNWSDRLKQMPVRSYWAEEDEPQYQIPPVYGRWFPHGVALKAGLVIAIETSGCSLNFETSQD